MKLALATIMTLCCATAQASDPAEVLFASRVLPLFKTSCLGCHGANADDIKAGFDMRTARGVFQGGESGEPAILPGRPTESPLYLAVTREHEQWSAMPPKEVEKLNPEQVDWIKEWIAAGAPWPSDQELAAMAGAGAAWSANDGQPVPTSGGLTPEWTSRRYKAADLWAFRPVKPPAIDAAAGVNPIDALIARQSSGAPALRADRRTLIRRVTFDLVGLPPTPAEIDAFVGDARGDDEVWAELVDRLLSSPHYGEQMARHWLDVTRYADSSGYANDYERGSAWRYRDYVVRSFNADKPYDQFVREQIAGDEMNSADPEMLVAVGFLRMGPWELTAMEVAKVARQRFLDDVTDAVGQVFLGQMLQCARCHDHKFDPAPTRDYYRIQAAFATTQVCERPAPFLAAESTRGFEEKKYLDARRANFQRELARIGQAEAEARAKWEAAHPRQSQKPPRHELLSTADLGLERIARKGIERLAWEYDRYQPFALSVYSGRTPDVKQISAPFRLPKDMLAGELETSHILAGGDPFSPKEPVAPGVLSAAGEAPLPATIEGRRKALADWIADPKNPLTPRVMANRVWQWTLGVGLAGAPNNFGATGKRPTHPELLDWLAAELVAKNWSVKQLQRTILLSECYRRSSRPIDSPAAASSNAAGANYAVFTPRRLAAEELRDAMLAVSGELNLAIGGVPVRPEINPEIAFQPRQVMGTFAPAWEPSTTPAERNRRSLYALKLRGVRDPLQEVFNAPSADLSCPAREVSTVAPQAFALFNAEATRARALAWAARLLKEAKTPEEAISRAFLQAFGRPPTEQEADACLRHWKSMTARHQGLTIEQPERPRSVTREAVEENTGEKFTFIERLESSADYEPDLSPADAPPELRGLMEVCLVLFNANEFIYLD